MKNRLGYYRHILQFEKKKDYAEFLGVNVSTLSRYLTQEIQPDTPNLYKIWLKIKERIPDLHMEDLLEE